jgi:hypothetical protein
MNKIIRPSRSHEINRRGFVGRALATAVIAGAPAFLRGQNLNNKLNIAFIGSGGRGNANLNELTVMRAVAARPASPRPRILMLVRIPTRTSPCSAT